MNKTLLNPLLNIIWTMLGFAAVIRYWLSVESLTAVYVFLVISLAAALIPSRYYQLSGNPRFYERLGVKKVRFWVQNGDWVQRLAALTPTAAVRRTRLSLPGYLKTVLMYERYHLSCLVFFGLTTGHAALHQCFTLAVVITISNGMYNLCPILLQQYNRARIKAVLRSRA